MITRKLRGLGLSSDLLNALGLASIRPPPLRTPRGRAPTPPRTTSGAGPQHDDAGHGERSAIFVGLWAPAFFVLAGSMVTVEQDPLV